MIPTFLGQPFYPYGFPINKENISINGKSILELFLLRCEGKKDKFIDNYLKEYLIYFINAPIFSNNFTQELRKKDFKKMKLDQAIIECLDFGLDPF